MLRTALVLIDLENEWTVKGSSYYVGDLHRLIKDTNRLIDISRKRGHRIIFIRHIEKGSAREFADKTTRTELLEGIQRSPRDTLITKYTIGAFERPELTRALRGIRHVVVAGILTNLCVRKFVEDAYDKGYGITIVSDCCVAFDRKTHAFTLNDLKATREEVNITTLDEF